MRIRTRLRSLAYRIRPPDPKPLILMYHRIADEPVDPWRLAVAAPRFEEQLEVLRRTRYPLSLIDFVRRFSAGTLPSHAVAVTFDDGYFDNLEAGRPLLESADVPATVFLATGYLDRPEQIWSDELARLILLGTAPRGFDLVVAGKPMRLELGAKPRTRNDGSIYGSRAKRRHAALTKTWDVLRHLEDGERKPIIAELRSKIEVKNYPAKPGRAMTTEEVLNLARSDLITIGAHTVTHPVLPALDAMACYREIKESVEACEALVGKPVESFAYPYGKFDINTQTAVRAAGLAYACSTREEPILPSSDALCLPRIHVSNIHGDAFEHALRLASIAR
jgi:peptidoglycan/xylan/chitin deacetylase (PgdA/CDA1 family)